VSLCQGRYSIGLGINAFGSAGRGGRGENCIQTFIKKTQRSEGNDVLKWIKEKEMCENVERNFLNRNRVHWRPFFEYGSEPWGN